MTEKDYLLLFSLVSGIGPARARLLIDFFGSARKAWLATDSEIIKTGLPLGLLRKMREMEAGVDIKEIYDRCGKIGVKILTWGDKDYPLSLKTISDPPLVLFLKGGTRDGKSLAELCKRSIAVVGTRRLTSYGALVTESLTSDLSALGFTIISGLARGIDTVAHRTALSSNGLTVGVLGSGIDIIYPSENKGLVEKIVSGSGFLVSEFPLGTNPLPANFPARNRIISAMSMGVLVTEAAQKSGSLITASLAAEQGKSVFVVPGPISSFSCQGTNDLIKKGAIPVTKVEDILLEFEMEGPEVRVFGAKREASLEEEILEILKREEATLDELSKMIEMKIDALSSVLTMLELSGRVKSYGGKWYIKAKA